MAEVTREKLYPNPLVTELVPLEKLWDGEAYHQNYYNDNPNQVCLYTSCDVLEGQGVCAVVPVGRRAHCLLAARAPCLPAHMLSRFLL